jgi:hypothetical protein
MLISEKQQEANRQNAQHSTGPKTPEGKQAVRLNAVTFGLRARSLLIAGEDPEEYAQLWGDLAVEWQPKTKSERLYVEQMSTSQWLLARIAKGESQLYDAAIPIDKKFSLLREVASQRTRLERSFTSAMHELQQLQKARKAQPRSQARQTEQAKPPVGPPIYVMANAAADHPACTTSATLDTP